MKLQLYVLCALGLVIAALGITSYTSIKVAQSRKVTLAEVRQEVADLERNIEALTQRQALLEESYMIYLAKTEVGREVIKDAERQIDASTESWLNDFVPESIAELCQSTINALCVSQDNLSEGTTGAVSNQSDKRSGKNE